MKDKIKKFATVTIPGLLITGGTCFAEGTGSTGSTVTTAITEAATSVKGDATTVIAAAVGVGVIFWGAKVLWRNFKSMAK